VAIALNVRVDWILDNGTRVPGLVIAGPIGSGTFAGESRWQVRLDHDPSQPQWLEGRDLVETASFVPAGPLPPPILLPGEPVSIIIPPSAQPGDDLRDPVQAVGLLALAMQLLKSLMRSPGRVTAAVWAQLPGWVTTALTQAGIVVGTEVTIEAFGGEGFIPGVGLPGSPGDGSNGVAPAPFPLGPQAGPQLPGHVPGMPGVHIAVVGTWIANGVLFYRLADGKLAVQNKKGRWKVWRPKRPIVLYATGAVDLKTLLRADAVLNKQAKRIAAMLNRRAPRRKTSKSEEKGTTIINVDGKAVH